MALKWRRADAYHLASECGRFTVTRVQLGQRLIYEAWRLADEVSYACQLGGFATSDEAKARCEIEARGRAGEE